MHGFRQPSRLREFRYARVQCRPSRCCQLRLHYERACSVGAGSCSHDSDFSYRDWSPRQGSNGPAVFQDAFGLGWYSIQPVPTHLLPQSGPMHAEFKSGCSPIVLHPFEEFLQHGGFYER